MIRILLAAILWLAPLTAFAGDQPVPLRSIVEIAWPNCGPGGCPRQAPPPRNDDGGEDPAKLSVKCWDASVRVEHQESDRLLGAVRSYGSGTVIAAEGDRYLVLTNRHVAPKADTYRIRLRNGKEYAATWETADARADLAAVSFACSDPVPVIAIADAPAANQKLVKIGYPEGKGPIAGAGYLLIGGADAPNVLTSILVHEGDSGSGVFRVSDSKLVAVIWGYRTNARNTSIAVANADVQRFAQACIRGWRRPSPRADAPPPPAPAPAPSPATPAPPPPAPPPGPDLSGVLSRLDDIARRLDALEKVKPATPTPPPIRADPTPVPGPKKISGSITFRVEPVPKGTP
jgi:S1-C subfamily serine protease